MRGVCLGLARRFHTGVDFWLSLELDELGRWLARAAELDRE